MNNEEEIILNELKNGLIDAEIDPLLILGKQAIKEQDNFHEYPLQLSKEEIISIQNLIMKKLLDQINDK